jgi:hypothetical protein
MRKDRKKGPGGGLMNEACQVVKLSFFLSFFGRFVEARGPRTRAV